LSRSLGCIVSTVPHKYVFLRRGDEPTRPRHTLWCPEEKYRVNEDDKGYALAVESLTITMASPHLRCVGKERNSAQTFNTC